MRERSGQDASGGGAAGEGRVTPIDIATIERLRAEGWTQSAIARHVGCSEYAVRYHKARAAAAHPATDFYPLDGVTFPLDTKHGFMWCMPIDPPLANDGDGVGCAHCAMESRCREHVALGDFMACERAPLRSEVRE